MAKADTDKAAVINDRRVTPGNAWLCSSTEKRGLRKRPRGESWDISNSPFNQGQKPVAQRAWHSPPSISAEHVIRRWHGQTAAGWTGLPQAHHEQSWQTNKLCRGSVRRWKRGLPGPTWGHVRVTMVPKPSRSKELRETAGRPIGAMSLAGKCTAP